MVLPLIPISQEWFAYINETLPSWAYLRPVPKYVWEDKPWANEVAYVYELQMQMDEHETVTYPIFFSDASTVGFSVYYPYHGVANIEVTLEYFMQEFRMIVNEVGRIRSRHLEWRDGGTEAS